MEVAAFGSSEYANVVLGSLWGTPPALDLDAEASLHKLLAALAEEGCFAPPATSPTAASPLLWRRRRFPLGIGAKVEQDQSLMVHPLFGLFAEPASTVLVTTRSIERLRDRKPGR
jgi:phosphoribosylformylglycinamidine (FGAM) synthase-like enzyme